MNSKVLISLLSLCALSSVISCEKSGEDMLIDDANLNINLRISSPVMTKTAGAGSVDDLENEYAISSLTICLVEADGLSPTTPVYTVSESKNLAWKLQSDGVYKVNAVISKDLTGDYLLYVIANKPSWLTIDTYSDICGSFSGTADEMSECWDEDSFTMVNKHDNVLDMDNAGVGITLAPLPADSKVNADVTIERLATKILAEKNPYMKVAPLLTQVLCSGDNPGDPDIKGAIATMTIDQYALVNCVNSFNLVQHWDEDAAHDGAPHLLVSPSSYAGTLGDGSDAYNMTSGYYSTPSELVFKDLGTPLYCMENNSPYYEDLRTDPGDATAYTKMKGRVTGIVFRAKAGYAKTFEGLVDINEGLDVEDLSDIVWQTKSGSQIYYSTLYQYKGKFYGDLACLQNQYSTLSGISSTDGLRSRGVKVYEDGYMYFTYWIEDSNYTDNGRHYYSVMRNTLYNITVTAINSVGDELPCGGTAYNRESPVSADVPKLSISIDIPDWGEKNGNYTIE